MRWTCPECGRGFGRVRQGHECAPAMSLQEYLHTSPAHERPVAELVLAHARTLPEAHVEPVQVGLFLKRSRTFVQLRTMTRWVALWVALPRVVTDPEPSRAVQQQGRTHHHVYNLHGPQDVTPAVLDLITEAYEADVPGA